MHLIERRTQVRRWSTSSRVIDDFKLELGKGPPRRSWEVYRTVHDMRELLAHSAPPAVHSPVNHAGRSWNITPGVGEPWMQVYAGYDLDNRALPYACGQAGIAQARGEATARLACRGGIQGRRAAAFDLDNARMPRPWLASCPERQLRLKSRRPRSPGAAHTMKSGLRNARRTPRSTDHVVLDMNGG
jgi:hypothetical protein